MICCSASLCLSLTSGKIETVMAPAFVSVQGVNVVKGLERGWQKGNLCMWLTVWLFCKEPLDLRGTEIDPLIRPWEKELERSLVAPASKTGPKVAGCMPRPGMHGVGVGEQTAPPSQVGRGAQGSCSWGVPARSQARFQTEKPLLWSAFKSNVV